MREAYVNGSLDELCSFFGSLRKFRSFNRQKIFFLLLIRQSDHEFRRPHDRSRFINRRCTFFAIIRRIR
ncbi:hypothetical protein Hanom_Chr03g00249931 [Helianthus anomalus]